MFQVQNRYQIIQSGFYDFSNNKTNLSFNQNFNQSLLEFKFLFRKVKKNFLNPNETIKPTEEYLDTYDLEINLLRELSPEFKIIVFYVNGREIVSDLAVFQMENCLRNEVNNVY